MAPYSDDFERTIEYVGGPVDGRQTKVTGILPVIHVPAHIGGRRFVKHVYNVDPVPQSDFLWLARYQGVME